MTSPQRLRANLANARRSTGPKTTAGRAKSAQNARRHGLRVPVLSERALADEVEHLAQKIVDGVPSELMDLARRIAEAEVDVQRVRRARNELVWRRGVEKLIDAPIALGDLVVFHRYERRALSRRKFAIRAFIAACATTGARFSNATSNPSVTCP
jgi:hypothetical protein